MARNGFFTEGEAMKRLSEMVNSIIDLLIVGVMFLITLPVRFLDKIVYDR